MPNAAMLSVADILDRGLTVDAIEASSSASRDALAPDRVVAAFRDAMLVAPAGLRDRAGIGDLVSVVGNASNPFQLATAFIASKYAELGGAGGVLGASTTAVTVCADSVGYFRHFQNGSIYWHPNSGAHEVHGLVRQKWNELQAERGMLGYPTTDEKAGADAQAAGKFNHFRGGSIYWHPAMGVHEVHGAIRDKYLALGAEGSILGYPTTDESGTPDGIGRFNHFQAGSIYWTGSIGAHEVHGLIRQYWADHGWERNAALGYPITDELIPDRQIGHVHPESARNPRLVPSDVIRFPMSVDNLSVATPAPPSPTPASPAATVDLSVRTALSRSTGTTLAAGAAATTAATLARVDLAGAATATGAGLRDRLTAIGGILVSTAATPGPERSQNRFGDFENGVMYWQRGAPRAVPLSPWVQSSDGGKMSMTGADVAAKTKELLAPKVATISGATLMGVAYVGTTGYWFDGAGAHNRRHRLHASVLINQTVSGTFGTSIVPVTATFEIQVEASFEPTSWNVAGSCTEWTLVSGGGVNINPPLIRQLHRVLDPILWTQFELMPIDDTEAGKPIAILSVKTQTNGNVNIYIEPGVLRFLDVLSTVADNIHLSDLVRADDADPVVPSHTSLVTMDMVRTPDVPAVTPVTPAVPDIRIRVGSTIRGGAPIR